MQTTERKHWENGHQIRGGWFHTYNLAIELGNKTIGVMVSWGWKVLPKIKFFEITCDGVHGSMGEILQCQECNWILREKETN